MNDEHHQHTTSPKTDATLPEGHRKKVLCIEDEFFIGELYERALRKAGYDPTNVLNGNDGLQVAQTDQYDAILLDLMIPGMTGIEILRILRDPSKTPHLKAKIIITTNLDQEESLRAELEKLADGYVIKAEMTPNELVAFLQTIVPSANE